MPSTYFFNGRRYVTPTTMSAVDDSAMVPTTLSVGNTLAILGQSDAGQPLVAASFGDPDQAAAVLGGGPLLYAVQKAFNASNDTAAPGLIIGVSIGAKTQAGLTLTDANGLNSIALAATQWGLPGNRTKMQISAGSVSGKRIEVQQGNSYYVQDNVTRPAFTVQYTGTAGTATMSIGNAAVTLYAPSGTAVATLNLNTYQTVAQLVDAISAVTGFTATAAGGAENTAALNGLDGVTNQDVKTALYAAKADLQAAIDWINGPGEGLIVASRPSTAVAPPANITWTFLSGGSASAPVLGDWTAALSLLQGEDVQWLVALSADQSVWAAVDAHVQYMSTVGQAERRAFVGPAAGTSLAAVEAMPINFDSDRTAIVWPGYYDYDLNGVLTLFDPFYSAVLVAAGFAAQNPGETMTNKTLTVRGLEVTPRIPTDTDALILAGVLTLGKTKKGYKVIRAISSWLADNKFDKCEIGCGAATDYAVQQLRADLDVLKGQRIDPLLIARAATIAETTCKTLSISPPDGIGVLVGDAASPPYRNIVAKAVGDAVQVSLQISPVITANYIPISISLVPYSGTASA